MLRCVKAYVRVTLPAFLGILGLSWPDSPNLRGFVLCSSFGAETINPSQLMNSKGPKLSPQSILQSSTPVSAAWLLHFRDARPPQEIQFQFERTLMTLMPPGMEAGKLVCRAKAKVTGAQHGADSPVAEPP